MLCDFFIPLHRINYRLNEIIKLFIGIACEYSRSQAIIGIVLAYYDFKFGLYDHKSEIIASFLGMLDVVEEKSH